MAISKLTLFIEVIMHTKQQPTPDQRIRRLFAPAWACLTAATICAIVGLVAGVVLQSVDIATICYVVAVLLIVGAVVIARRVGRDVTREEDR